jgi:hypothetical protein
MTADADSEIDETEREVLWPDGRRCERRCCRFRCGNAEYLVQIIGHGAVPSLVHDGTEGEPDERDDGGIGFEHSFDVPLLVQFGEPSVDRLSTLSSIVKDVVFSLPTNAPAPFRCRCCPAECMPARASTSAKRTPAQRAVQLRLFSTAPL